MLVAYTRLFRVSRCIYIYICCADFAQEYILPYMRICTEYMHIWSVANIYIDHIYMFAMFIYLYLCIMCAAYVQMGANWCKCMLYCTSGMHIDGNFCTIAAN